MTGRAARAEPIFWFADRCFAEDFPPTERALRDPQGLLAAGGDLSPGRLVDAYRRGIFPWYSEGQPLLWWSPDPRSVLGPRDCHVSRSLAKRRRNGGFEFSFDREFDAVIAACAAPRAGASGTWITDAMRAAYGALHRQGIAHSVECWAEGSLVGGLYGIALGCVFFGESMFSLENDASKLAFVELCGLLDSWGYGLIDCQVHNDHLGRLGARTLERAEFERRLDQLLAATPAATAWHKEASA